MMMMLPWPWASSSGPLLLSPHPSWGFCFCRPFVAITPSTIYLHSFLIISCAFGSGVLGVGRWQLAESRAAARLIVWPRCDGCSWNCRGNCPLISPFHRSPSLAPSSLTPFPTPLSTAAPFASEVAILGPSLCGLRLRRIPSP